MKKSLLCILLALCLMLSVPVKVHASELGQAEPYAVSMIQYYLHHQEAATDVIWDLTQKMKAVDEKQAAVWEKLMFDWAWINADMPVYENALADGLPQDDSLCIVVMGFGLKEDGSIQPELEDRLVVALTSAIKYPNAYVLVTGGQTGAAEGVTEAGQMAAWLKDKGLEEHRILQDPNSLSTTANAVNCYKLLTSSYPQVDSIAIVTSDYHIAQSCALFSAVSSHRSGYKGGKSLELVGNAVCDTGLQEDSLLTQAWGISLIFGIPFEENTRAPELYPVEIPVEVYTEPPETEPPVPGWPDLTGAPAETEEPDSQEKWQIIEWAALAAAGGVALVIFFLFMPKKPKKRNHRERPKMNWDV